MTRVLLADDHKLMRGGLRLIIGQHPEFTVVGEADDGRQAVALTEALKPDVIVMDIGMPNLNGIEASFQITQAHPEIAVIMLSMHSDESYVLRALKAGARGYLLKDSAEADLILALRAVTEGKSFFSPAVSRVLLEDYMRKLRRAGAEDSWDLLTPNSLPRANPPKKSPLSSI
jgi:DNA-binding NarL/FixJ family response regulator